MFDFSFRGRIVVGGRSVIDTVPQRGLQKRKAWVLSKHLARVAVQGPHDLATPVWIVLWFRRWSRLMYCNEENVMMRGRRLGSRPRYCLLEFQKVASSCSKRSGSCPHTLRQPGYLHETKLLSTYPGWQIALSARDPQG